MVLEQHGRHGQLLVEDCRPLRPFIRALISELPELPVIDEAADGLEAVEKAQQLRPDLILMDIGLPKLDGIEAARRIREFLPSSKIVFLTQQRAGEALREAISVGAWGYILRGRRN